jgi:hypothetical protein
MATFGELQTQVSSRLKDPNNTSVSASIVADVLNEALQYWSKKPYWFNEFRDVVTLTEDDPVLTLTTDAQYVFDTGGITIDYANTRWPVKKITSDEYDCLNVQGRGIPYAWVYRNGGYELYGYPDAAYTALVRGIKNYTDLSGDSDTNDFTINAPDLLRYEALARLYGEFRQDPKMEAYYAARATNEHTNLRQATNRLNGSGEFQVEGF